jgi:hypothetical protein
MSPSTPASGTRTGTGRLPGAVEKTEVRTASSAAAALVNVGVAALLVAMAAAGLDGDPRP